MALMADPRIVDNPLHVEEVSYTELRELIIWALKSYMTRPFSCEEKGIPVHIRNTNQPELEAQKSLIRSNIELYRVLA